MSSRDVCCLREGVQGNRKVIMTRRFGGFWGLRKMNELKASSGCDTIVQDLFALRTNGQLSKQFH